MKKAEEVNFDGIVGPTHNYSGLAYGNIASMENAALPSNPKKAALEGLNKMHTLMKLGIRQAVLPPHERPFIPLLRILGYYESEEKLLGILAKNNPQLLKQAFSSSAMWAANAATITPSSDTADGKVHFTPASLTQFHRSFEAPTTGMILQRIFSNPKYFYHHYPLPPHPTYGDEGAANHTRLCAMHGSPGLHLFVYGKCANDSESLLPKRFPARQTLEASQAIARLHLINPHQVIYARQNPSIIDLGVFHNDVIAVGNENLLLFHEQAWSDGDKIVNELREKAEQLNQFNIHFLKVSDEQISVKEAIKTYFFNSQIVTKADGSMVMIAPEECKKSAQIQKYIQDLLKQSDHPIKNVVYHQLKESMLNGGGPGCLRLRVVLTEEEIAAMNPSVLLTEPLYKNLVEWVHKHYRDRLTLEDLSDPKLILEGRQALDELTWLLQLGPIYPFQQFRRETFNNAH